MPANIDPPTPPLEPPAPQPPEDTPAVPPIEPEGQLGQLRRELYAREESQDMQDRDSELHRLGIRRKTLPADTDEGRTNPALFERVAEQRAKRRRKWLIGGGLAALLVVLFGAAVGGTLWYRLRHNVTQDQIHLALDAPTEFTAGESLTYKLEYRNDSYVNWQGVEVSFEPPRGWRYTSSSQELARSGKVYSAKIGDVKSGASGTIDITGQLIGEQNASVVAKAEMLFTPENFPSGQFTQQAVATTTITVVPVDVAIDATDESENGQRLLVTIHVRNNSSNALNGAYLLVNPAPGIQLAAEDEQFSPGFSAIDSTWDLGTLEPLAQLTRQLVMYVDGQAGERRTLEVQLGVKEGEEKILQRTQSQVVTITASALAIEQHYNDESGTLVVAPEAAVKGNVTFTNIGNVGLKNAVIKVQFDGSGLNVADLKLPSGAYDPTTRTITWTAATVPELATIQPKQTGTIPYEFTILPTDQFPTTADAKNNILIANATIDSPDLVTATGEKRNLVSDRMVISIATTLQLEAAAFYDDGRLGITSTGPIPPKVGQQTTYTVRLRLGSALNDVGDVRLSAVLPDGIKYTGKTYKTTGEVTFNERTGEVLWTLPQLAGLTGRTKPAEELQFQVAITPGENQVGQEPVFLNSLKVSGTDLFTEESVSQEVKDFPTTTTAVPKQGKIEN